MDYHLLALLNKNHVVHLELIDSKVQSSEIIIREKEVSEYVAGKTVIKVGSVHLGMIGCWYY